MDLGGLERRRRRSGCGALVRVLLCIVSLTLVMCLGFSFSSSRPTWESLPGVEGARSRAVTQVGRRFLIEHHRGAEIERESGTSED